MATHGQPTMETPSGSHREDQPLDCNDSISVARTLSRVLVEMGPGGGAGLAPLLGNPCDARHPHQFFTPCWPWLNYKVTNVAGLVILEC